MQAMAPNADVVAVYGSTEAEPIAHITDREMSEADRRAMLAGKGLLAGVPVSSIQLRILRDSWGRPVGPFDAEEFVKHCLPPDQPGEIVVSGGHVLPGYLHGVGDEETKFRVDGMVWHRTGDAGYLDGSGRVWLLGRCSARIGDQHGVVYPFAAETAIYQDAGVRRAALVAHKGRRILALEFYDGGHLADLARGALRPSPGRTLMRSTSAGESRWTSGHNAKIDYPRCIECLTIRDKGRTWSEDANLLIPPELMRSTPYRRFRWMLYFMTAGFLLTEVLAWTGIVSHLRPVSFQEVTANILFAIGFGCPLVLYLSTLPRWRECIGTFVAGLLLALLFWAIQQWLGLPPASKPAR